MNVFLFGDIVGEAGLHNFEEGLPEVLKKYACGGGSEREANFVIANGENAADGYGLTVPLAERIFAAGVDVITSGNHVWEKKPFVEMMQNFPSCLRPANYGEGVPGYGYALKKVGLLNILVVNLQGRKFMFDIENPFTVYDRIMERALSGVEGPVCVIVDFHGESTEEKEAFGNYADGRAAVVVGTHTHVQTADEKLLPGGTAYITDLGMCGPDDSIIGMDKGISLARVRNQVLYHLTPASGPCSIQGIVVSIDEACGKAISIKRIREIETR
jgi:metallophosphoesterase (TIGR00282 family)